METTANNATNVSQGKPKIAGSVHVAFGDATLPTDATTELDAGFVNLGYLSEDGVTNSNSIETSETKAWGGDVVLSSLTGKTDKWKMTFIEAMNLEVLKTIYGAGNVTGTLATGIKVMSKAEQPESHAFVIDMILKGGVLKRIVIPSASISSIDDISYKDSDPIGYGIELTAVPDATGTTHYEYVKSKGAGE